MKDLFGWIYEICQDDERVAGAYSRVMDGWREHDSPMVTSGKIDLIGAARDLQNPWLEVFGRHWDLQHRLNNLNEGSAAVRDAVEAFEIAHRPENLDCPQTICSAQDLAIAYTRTDGPGYAAEVIEACSSTLERIDPSWPCYDCVSAELREGLANAGRHDEAIALIDDVERKIRSQGSSPTLGYETGRLEALLELGRFDEAETVVATVDPSQFAHHSERSIPGYQCQVARLRVRQGRHDEACAIHADLLDPVEHIGSATSTLQLVDEMIASGAAQDSELFARQRVSVASAFAERGAIRSAFNIAIQEAVAAANRGAVRSARRTLDFAEKLQTELARPDDAPQRIERALAAIAAAPDAVHDAFPVDQRVEELLALHDEGELDDQRFDELVGILSAQGWTQAPGEMLRERADKHPDDADRAATLFFWLLGAGDLGAAEETIERIADVDETLGFWAEANLAHRKGDYSRCAERCALIVSRQPDAVNTRRLWAAAERELGDFGSAASIMEELLGLLDEPSPPDWWNAIVAGSLAGDWQLVRLACALLDITLESSDGEVVENWEFCHLTFVEDDGREVTHGAHRTGPATARVVSVAFPDVIQRVHDEVVFEPVPLDPRPEDPDEAAATPVRFAALVTTRTAEHHSFLIDCVAPHGGWEVLRDQLYQSGYPVWMYGDGDVDLEDGSSATRFFAAVAVGPGGSDAELASMISDLTQDWPMRVAHRELTEAIGGDGSVHVGFGEAIWDLPSHEADT